ncbi:MAG: bifunctional UDP-N-acetylglucosamine diphosphorylase/glucosamine-1-phosphate N-acetyltransferase GlmU [Firmicutes bacterium]|nr:bifunctional UDP-N-acetylglucosamine diphosphorylase/glucosamine-1-phosphate N-acetyltransferase GlmU [Bacillota bacterium]
MSSLKALILAAGEGTRMKSDTPKVLHKILNKSMIDYVLDAASDAGADKICVVVGSHAEKVTSALEERNITFAEQKERLGTGHAVMCAKTFVEGEDSDILILYGDTPLLKGETLKELVEFHKKEGNSATLLSAFVDNPKGYGRIVRNEKGLFAKNVEEKDTTDEEKKINEINAGVYCFKSKDLLYALDNLKNDNAAGEYYLPDALEIILSAGGRVNAFAAEDPDEFLGVNSKVQLYEALKVMQRRINYGFMEDGITIIDPENTFLSPDTVIGKDTVIYPGVFLEGGTVIGRDCEIGPDCRLSSVKVGDGTTIEYSRIKESRIGNNTTVGPFAYIRPDCVIGDNVKVGDFVEVKNSTVGDGTKISHLTYIGDTDAGRGINFGCGTVTVNYNGKAKFRTTIEDDSFIGCNTNLIAPVKVGKGAYIAAGSTVNRDVPEDAFTIARVRQKNYENGKNKLKL